MRTACRYHDGAIQWRYPDEHGPTGGVWFAKSRDSAERLAEQFRKTAKRQGFEWFAPMALEYARQLEAAIEEYDAQETAA